MKDLLKNLLNNFFSRYQISLEVSSRSNDFRWIPLIWLKTSKSTINPKDNDIKRFQYTATVALNPDKIGKKSEINLKIKIEKRRNNSKKRIYKLFLMFSLKKKLYTAYVSKHNSKYGKKIVPLMFDKEVWYYL